MLITFLLLKFEPMKEKIIKELEMIETYFNVVSESSLMAKKTSNLIKLINKLKVEE